MSMQGVSGEDNIELNKADNKQVRQRSLRLLGSLIRPVRRRFIWSFVVVIISQALRVLGPALIAFGIDQALPQAVNGNQVLIIVVVSAYVISAIGNATLIRSYLVYAAKINQDVLIDLRQRIFVHSQKLSVDFHEKYTSGRVISRQTSDLDSIRELLDSGSNEMIAGILYAIFTAVALVILDAPSFLVILASMIPLFFLTRWFQKTPESTIESLELPRPR